jgi:hypothetical protein
MLARVAALLLLLVQAQQIAVPALCAPMHHGAEQCHQSAPPGPASVVAMPSAPGGCADMPLCAAPASVMLTADVVALDVPELGASVEQPASLLPPSACRTPPTPPPQA